MVTPLLGFLGMDNTPQEPICTHRKITLILGAACVTGATQCGFWFGHIAQQTVSGFTWQLYGPLLVTILLCAWAFKVNRDTSCLLYTSDAADE